MLEYCFLNFCVLHLVVPDLFQGSEVLVRLLLLESVDLEVAQYHCRNLADEFEVGFLDFHLNNNKGYLVDLHFDLTFVVLDIAFEDRLEEALFASHEFLELDIEILLLDLIVLVLLLIALLDPEQLCEGLDLPFLALEHIVHLHKLGPGAKLLELVEQLDELFVLDLGKDELALDIIVDVFAQTVLLVLGHEEAEQARELLVVLVPQLQEVQHHLFEVGQHRDRLLYEAVE